MLRHDKPQGEGASLRTGLARARHPLLFYAPCEPRYRPGYLNRLLVEPLAMPEGGEPRPVIDTVHLTTGYHAGVPTPLPWRIAWLLFRFVCRVLFNAAPQTPPGWLGWDRICSWFVCRIVFGIRNRDVTCPVRLLRREILQRMPLQSDGCFVHAEILAKANFLTLLLSEDLPLGDREANAEHRPEGTPPPSRSEPARQMWRDGWRVFWSPEFGPVQPPPSCEPVAQDAG